MPPRLHLPREPFSPADLPILPFLCLRVFQPWPWPGRGRRTISSVHKGDQEFEKTPQLSWIHSAHENARGTSASSSVPVVNRRAPPDPALLGLASQFLGMSVNKLYKSLPREPKSISYRQTNGQDGVVPALRAPHPSAFEKNGFNENFERTWGQAPRGLPVDSLDGSSFEPSNIGIDKGDPMNWWEEDTTKPSSSLAGSPTEDVFWGKEEALWRQSPEHDSPEPDLDARLSKESLEGTRGYHLNPLPVTIEAKNMERKHASGNVVYDDEPSSPLETSSLEGRALEEDKNLGKSEAGDGVFKIQFTVQAETVEGGQKGGIEKNALSERDDESGSGLDMARYTAPVELAELSQGGGRNAAAVASTSGTKSLPLEPAASTAGRIVDGDEFLEKHSGGHSTEQNSAQVDSTIGYSQSRESQIVTQRKTTPIESELVVEESSSGEFFASENKSIPTRYLTSNKLSLKARMKELRHTFSQRKGLSYFRLELPLKISDIRARRKGFWTPALPTQRWKASSIYLTLQNQGLKTRESIPKILKKVFAHEEPLAMFHKIWLEISQVEKERSWPVFMFFTSRNYPKRLLDILEATYIYPYPPRYAVKGFLQTIIRRYAKDQNYYGEGAAFHDRVLGLLLSGPRYNKLSNLSSRWLLSTFSVDNPYDQDMVLRLYKALEIYYPFMTLRTLISFSSSLALSGHRDEAFLLLQEIASRKSADFESTKILKLCSNIIRHTQQDKKASTPDSEMFQFMLDCGLRPNMVHYNILLQNALLAGDTLTGWRIYEMMTENDIKADAFTYSILLNDAKKRTDWDDVRRIIGIIGDKEIKSPQICLDTVHALFLFCRNSSSSSFRKSTFAEMVSVYRDIFDDEPLAHIIPRFLEQYPRIGSRTGLLSLRTILLDEFDPAPLLYVMLAGYIASLDSSLLVKEFYDKFRDLVFAKDPIVANLSKTTHIWVAFLRAFGTFPDRIADCPILVGDMIQIGEIACTEMPTATLRNGYTYPNLAFRPAMPDVYIWTILVEIFMKNGQARAAERALAMMRDRGVEPNLVTWTVLAYGYSRMHDADNTIDVFRRMMEAGVKPDEHCMAALTTLPQRKKVLNAVRMFGSVMQASDLSESLASDVIDEESFDVIEKRHASRGMGRLAQSSIRQGAGQSQEQLLVEDLKHKLYAEAYKTEMT